MTQPQSPYTLNVVGGVYRFHWETAQVYITVDRIRETRGVPAGEIRVQAYPEGHIHLTTLNLLSTRSRNEVAKFCAERGSLIQRDWAAIIEEMCVAVLDRFRQGEPTVRLGDVRAPTLPEWQLEPLILAKESTLIYGYGGIGKSYLAAFCSVLVDQGISFGKLEPRKARVLYLDYETGQASAARRFNSLHNGFGLDVSSDVLYRFCWQPIASETNELQRIVAEEDIGLVVVDSAGPACGGEPEAAAAAISYFTALRSLQVSTLTIAHQSKGAGSVGPFGSVYWVNYPRNTFELKKAQNVGEDIIHVALIHRKANEGRLQASVSYRFSFEESTVRIMMEMMEDVPEFFSTLPLTDKMLLTLKDAGPISCRELADLLEANVRSVQTKLSSDSRFSQEGNNTWGVRTHYDGSR